MPGNTFSVFPVSVLISTLTKNVLDLLKSTKKIVDFNSSGSYDFILFVWLRGFHKCQNKLSSAISGRKTTCSDGLAKVSWKFLERDLLLTQLNFRKAKLSNSTRIIKAKLKHSKKIKVSGLFISLSFARTHVCSLVFWITFFRLMVLFK